jgi:hypothetical protein
MIIVFLFQTYAQISSDTCNENSLKTQDLLEVDEITPKLFKSYEVAILTLISVNLCVITPVLRANRRNKYDRMTYFLSVWYNLQVCFNLESYVASTVSEPPNIS